MITKRVLENLYLERKLSVAAIAALLHCSQNRINYWLAKYSIKKRSIADAMYARHNPNGNPFTIRAPTTDRDLFLLGLGLGLYWGEGNKANKLSIRLGNTDPKLIKYFILFLIDLFHINKKKLRFGLQIFSDVSEGDALAFWLRELKDFNIDKDKFQKIVITQARSLGTYKNKNRYGVLTVYYHNRKLRDIICKTLQSME